MKEKAGDTVDTLWQMRNNEKARIRYNGNFVGGILLLLLGANLLVSLLQVVGAVLGFLDLTQEDYGIGNTAYLLLSMLSYVLYLALPTVILLFAGRRLDNPFPVRRVPRGVYPLALFGGMTVAVFGNWASGLIVNFLTGLGVPYPDLPQTVEPTGMSLLLNLIGTALLPALLEELLFRGMMLGALRPQGDKAAVIVSAIFFGLIHGNVLQVPFATILGLILGWLTVRTGSIVPAVLLHFVNNATSVLLEFVGCYTDSEPVLLAAFFVTCIGGLAVFLTVYTTRRCRDEDLLRPLTNGGGLLELRERMKTVLTAPALLVGGILWILVLLTSLLA